MKSAKPFINLESALDTEHKFKMNKHYLLKIALSVFAIKFIIYLLDPSVQFFLGDSQSYIWTALSGWIPPDRSFVYGFCIWLLTYFSESLSSLVFFQVVCSGFTAIMSGYILSRFLGVHVRFAWGFSILCALEPIQLLYERYAMTETLSLFVFCLYCLCVLYYLEKKTLWMLLPINLLGIVVLAFRLSFLAVILAGMIGVPILAYLHQAKKQLKPVLGKTTGMLMLLVHLGFSGITGYGVHQMYKALYGFLSNSPPAYSNANGYFLISSLSPLLKAMDFPDVIQAQKILAASPCNLTNHRARLAQLFRPDCLVDRIKKSSSDEIMANTLANQVGLNVLKRDPLGVLALNGRLYFDYFDLNRVTAALRSDRGELLIPDDFRKLLRDYYHLDVPQLPNQKTITNRYFYFAIPWYLLVVTLPLLFPILLIPSIRRHIANLIGNFFFMGIVCVLLITVISLGQEQSIRHLHAIAWLSLILIASIVGSGWLLPAVSITTCLVKIKTQIDKNSAILVDVTLLGLMLSFAILTRMITLAQFVDLAPWPDSVEYVVAAKQFLETGKFEIWLNEYTLPSRYSWGFPSMIAATMLMMGQAYTNGLYTVILCSCISVVLVYVITKYIYKSRVAAVFSAMLLASSPLDLFLSRHIMSDIPFTTIMLLSLLFVFKGLESRHVSRSFIIAGLLAGFSAWVRNLGIIYVPFIVLVICFRNRYFAKPVSISAYAFHPAILFFTAFVLMQLPILLNNAIVFGGIFKTGYDFWLGDVTSFSWSYLFDAEQRLLGYLAPVILGTPGFIMYGYPLALYIGGFTVPVLVLMNVILQVLNRHRQNSQMKDALYVLFTVGGITVASYAAYFWTVDIRFIHITVPVMAILAGGGMSQV